MTDTLQEQIGIATAGQQWQIDDYTLLESTEPGIVCYVCRTPVLMRDGSGRAQAMLTRTLRWQDNAYALVGGTALLTVTAQPTSDLNDLRRLKDRWRMVVLNSGYTGEPKFVPLPMRNLRIETIIDPSVGKGREQSGANDAASTTATLALDLTQQGTQQWLQGIGGQGQIAGGIRLHYTYPQLMPAAQAQVTIHGLSLYAALASALHRTADGGIYGSEDEIRSAWADLVRGGDIEITIDDLPADMEPQRSKLLATLAEQARHHVFDQLFAPSIPGSTTTNQTDYGTNYTLRWRSRSDATDITLSLAVEAWTWLNNVLGSDFTTLLKAVGANAVTTIYADVSLPVTVTVDASPLLSSVAASIVFSEGRAPEAPIFGATGGTTRYVLTTAKPDGVTVRYNARVSYTPRNWPVMELSGERLLTDGGNQIALHPGALVHSHTIYMYVRDGDRIKGPNEVAPDDYLVLNVRYQPAGVAPIRESLRITARTPVVFRYPTRPDDASGQATLSAVGLVGGKMVRSADLALDPQEESIFILVDSGTVQIVSKSAVLPESDRLAQRLLAAGARPTVGNGSAHIESGTAIAESGQGFEVDLQVPLIPQPTDVSCWAGALAMVVSYRDQASYAPETIAEAAGMDVYTGYGWNDIRTAVATWNLRERGPASALPSEWSRLLRLYGPLWIVEVGAPYHAVVLGGIAGDGTADGSWVTVYNPWAPNQGAIEYKWFTDFDYEFGLGAGADAMIVHA